MANLIAYRNSEPDWRRLRSYARRVAKETKVVPVAELTHGGSPILGPHWLLATTTESQERNLGNRLEDMRVVWTYALLDDGTLVLAKTKTVEATPGAAPLHIEHHHEVRPLDRRTDVEHFDFVHQSRHGKLPGGAAGTGEFWTHGERGSRLLYDQAGIGLSLTLKRLLTGS